MVGSRVRQLVRALLQPVRHTILPLLDAKSCAWLTSSCQSAAAGSLIYSLCCRAPFIRSVHHSPGFINLNLLLCALSSSPFLVLYFFLGTSSIRAFVQLCRTYHRHSFGIPFATLTHCTTIDTDDRRESIETYTTSRQPRGSHVSSLSFSHSLDRPDLFQ